MQLRKLLSSAYPHISIRPTCRLPDFFLAFKDRIPFAFRLHVVYKCKCQLCQCWAHCMLVKHTDIYTRESQNIWVFHPKLEINSLSQMSAVLTHHHFSKHTISDSDFTILTSSNSKFDLSLTKHFFYASVSILISNRTLI